MLKAACAVSLLLAPFGSAASEVTLTPSVSASAEFTDNLAFASRDTQSDTFMTLTPALAAESKTERVSVRAESSASVVRYAHHEENNATRQSHSLRTQVAPTERFQWSLGGSFREQSTLETELGTSGLLVESSQRRSYGPDAGANYRLGERSQLGVAYSYVRTTFDSDRFVDNRSHHADATLQRTLDDRGTTVSLHPRFSLSESEASSARIYGLSLGWASKISETFELSASAGGSYSVSRLSPSPSRPGGDRAAGGGLLADLSAVQTWETSSLSLTYSRATDYSSLGDVIDSDSVVLSAEKAFSEHGSGVFRAAYRRSRSRSDPGGRSSSYWDVGPSLRWQFAERHSLQIAYNHGTSITESASGDLRAERNRVWVTASFAFPRQW
jgi:hypothetical protein